MQEFTNCYSLSKTLRFELRAVGETAERIEDFKNEGLKSIVAEDRQRAQDYIQMKRILDDYHRFFIEEVLSEEIFTKAELEDYADKYCQAKASGAGKDVKDKLVRRQKEMRQKIGKAFAAKSKDYHLYKGKFSKLVNESGSGAKKTKGRLWDWLKKEYENEDISQEEFEDRVKYVSNFNQFSTYFTGFNQNRDNVYSDKDQQTAISYRIVNENLTKHFDNCIRFDRIEKKFPELAKLLSEYSEMFKPSAFTQCLSQSGITEYNEKIGHKSDDINAKGVNQLINEFGQKNHIKARELPKMAILYKQILSDIDSRFIVDKFVDDKEVFNAIKDLHSQLLATELLSTIKNILNEYLTAENSDKIYVKALELTGISNAVWGQWSVVGDALNNYAENYLTLTKKQKEQWDKRDCYSIKEVQEAVDIYLVENEDIETKDICQYFKGFQRDGEEFASLIEQSYQELKPVLELEQLHKDRRIDKEGFKQVEKIRIYLDSLLSVGQFLRPLFMVKGGKKIEIAEVNIDFYDSFNEAYRQLDKCFVIYNKVRNHVTKKPYSTDKFKINFENSTLLDGWDVSKETDNTSVLLFRGGKYYLGIMKKSANKMFDYIASAEDSEKKAKQKQDIANEALADVTDDYFEKMVYKLLPDPSKMLPKVFFSKKNIDFYSPSEELNNIRDNGLFKKDADDIDSLHKWIEFMKVSLSKHPEWSKYFNFDFLPTKDYSDVSSFYKQVANDGYHMSFDKIKASYIESKIASGELYLFEIYSKDFSPYSKGRPNLHTSYWKLLFNQNNLNDLVLKLNGQAEVFFRKASLDKKKNEVVIHRKNEALANKNPLSEKKYSKFDYDIVKDKRFTKDKFFFHCPITLNFKGGIAGKFNDKVNKYVTDNDVKIIGIDRGERHLLYYSLINKEGEIIEQGSLNRITNNLVSGGKKIYKTTDYHQLLDGKEKERDAARKSWTAVENIKELKSGYLSHVVHKIATLMVEHNAVVVLEDLNFGFKRGRFKVEKQVYQKFEKALIDKLNYLVFKDRDFGQAGHYLKAYQFTAPFESFQKLGKQSGFLYYVPAWNTSKIDPVTGFVSLVKVKYESVDKSRNFLSKFDSIKYNSEKDYFEFELDYSKFTDRAADKKVWTICTHGKQRYRYNREERKYNCYDVTGRLKKVLKENNIDYSNGDLIEAITSVCSGKKETAAFYREVMFCLGLTLQLRHSYKENGEEIDFILSPVADANGDFFDSRRCSQDSFLPCDADANGAYNIARKGLLLLDKIRKNGKAEAVSNKDWLDFVQQE
ncbi:MAG: type V CRISPR-associated protein Cas12a/Cpf1 [Sedimentisphaeraceae bacterium JB056]